MPARTADLSIALIISGLAGCADPGASFPNMDAGSLDAGSMDAGLDASDASAPICQAEAGEWECRGVLNEPCPPVALDMQGQPFEEWTGHRSSLADVHCVLLALRDGTPGRLSSRTEYAEGRGYELSAYTHWSYQVLDNGMVVRSLRREQARQMPEASFDYVAPKPFEYFKDCQQHDFGPELYACMTEWAARVLHECPTCPEPTLEPRGF
jgi:hypothetical protein